jgi:hypothetical protein
MPEMRRTRGLRERLGHGRHCLLLQDLQRELLRQDRPMEDVRQIEATNVPGLLKPSRSRSDSIGSDRGPALTSLCRGVTRGGGLSLEDPCDSCSGGGAQDTFAALDALSSLNQGCAGDCRRVYPAAERSRPPHIQRPLARGDVEDGAKVKRWPRGGTGQRLWEVATAEQWEGALPQVSLLAVTQAVAMDQGRTSTCAVRSETSGFPEGIPTGGLALVFNPRSPRRGCPFKPELATESSRSSCPGRG